MINEHNDQGERLTFPSVINNYRVLGTINRGSFSVVELVENIKTGTKYACKVISRNILKEKETILHFEQEIRFHQTLKHENICELIEIIFREDYIFMILEYCSRGELFDFISKNGRASPAATKRIFAQLVRAVNYLHSKNIAHRDLKLENIYLNEDFNVKLGDFGFCHSSDKQTLLSTSCGSCFYVAPEIIRGEQYDGKKADVWSLGIVLFVISVGALPWSETNQIRLFEQIERADYKIPNFVSREIQDIIRMCLKVDPNERPDIGTLMELPYISGYTETSCKEQESADPANGGAVAGSFVTRRRPLIVRPISSSCRASVDANNLSKMGSINPPLVYVKKRTKKNVCESAKLPEAKK